MLKTLLRPAMIFIPFLLGACFPQAHVLNEAPFHLVKWFLCIMVFTACLQLDFKQLKPRKEHGTILLLNLLMGIVPYFLLKILIPGEPVYAVTAFFVGITPTATAAPVVVSFLNGRTGFALTGFTITNLGVALALIVLLPMVTGNWTGNYIWSVADTLVRVIALPFFAAMIVRKIYPGAKELPKKCKLFSLSLWSFCLFILAAIARNHFIENPEESVSKVLLIGLISLVICISNFALGKLLSRKKFCRESSQILGQKNTTLTLYLALHYAGPLVAMGTIFYILWHNLWNAWQMYAYDRRKWNRKHHAGCIIKDDN
ncbi:MAG: hypothetical protein IJW05_03900 [Lentisphaeria bacterium]|nr:hypothetical protein [Lentisphaeria bacterium]